VIVLATQWYLGALQPTEVSPQFWSLAYPYAAVLAVWFVAHLTLTAWRLDHDRDEREPLLIDVDAHISYSSREPVATVFVTNRGSADELSAEITRFGGVETGPSGMGIRGTRWARWHGSNGATSVQIPEQGVRAIHLAKLLVPDRVELTAPQPPAVTVYSATDEYQARMRWRNDVRHLLDRIIVTMVLRSKTTGKLREVSFVIIASFSSVNLYREIYLTVRGTRLDDPLPYLP
jgi:hypothetical protein